MSTKSLDDILGATESADSIESATSESTVLNDSTAEMDTSAKSLENLSAADPAVSKESSTSKQSSNKSSGEAASLDADAEDSPYDAESSKLTASDTDNNEDASKPDDIKYPRYVILRRPITLYKGLSLSTSVATVGGTICIVGPETEGYVPVICKGSVSKLSGYVQSSVIPRG